MHHRGYLIPIGDAIYFDFDFDSEQMRPHFHSRNTEFLAEPLTILSCSSHGIEMATAFLKSISVLQFAFSVFFIRFSVPFFFLHVLAFLFGVCSHSLAHTSCFTSIQTYTSIHVHTSFHDTCFCVLYKHVIYASRQNSFRFDVVLSTFL